eukprot:TRINITY_DN10268_c0_g1_i4.p1 TRINITY_DN10268_c0_g1~~TRINITY_DN10268_c0_g1_i4.p1  ORF type:complete len:546 (-),score=119.99 TRINITY_DN10268_c0_g1_i4:37-1674(-)
MSRVVAKAEDELFLLALEAQTADDESEAGAASGQGRSAWRRGAVALGSLASAAVLGALAWNALHQGRIAASSVASTADTESQQLWNLKPGHLDPQGHTVADTWDHYVFPNCDEGPAPGAMHTVWVTQKYYHKYNKYHGRWVYKSVPKWVPLLKTPAQADCVAHKAAAWAFHQKQIGDHWAFVGSKNKTGELYQWQGEHDCEEQFANVDFVGALAEQQDENGKPSGAHCQQACTRQPDCDGFSWISPYGCYLKTLDRSDGRETFETETKKGVYSGYACKREKAREYEWLVDEKEKYTLPEPPDAKVAPNKSMLCLELVVPYSYEVDLIIMQYKKGLSIFSCENYKVYSSQLLRLADGLHTRKLNTSQKAELAGQWDTALNTDIFMAFWRAVILDGDYLDANWVVKVDPDTVWFPFRLAPVLGQQEEQNHTSGNGVYLNNCPQGLHGPIEVFSQNAVRTLALRSRDCYVDMQDWGDAQWGEDMWVDQCFRNTAHVTLAYIPSLLAEAHCNRWPGWESCSAQDKIAFHPYKDPTSWMTCVNRGLPKET